MVEDAGPRPGDEAEDWHARASAAQLRAVVENIDEGLVVADSQGAIVTINQRAREMIGYPSGEARSTGYHISEFRSLLAMSTLDGRPLRLEERPMVRLMAGESFTDFEVRCTRIATGEEWVASFVGTPVFAADGSIQLAVLSARDITERKRAEEALRAADRQKDAFIAALAHELRNPLAPILSAAELLIRADDATAERRRLGTLIARQTGHLTRIVDDLLDVSRVTSGRIELRRERVDLAELLRDLAEDHRPEFEGAGLQLVVDISRSGVWVDGDPTRLTQIVENLLSNALKFTDAGGTVAVELREGDATDTARIVVRDTGIGIGPELAGTLWDPFSQGARPPRQGTGGLGLGTALIKGLTELHGGTVSASSGAREGSEFIVTLPTASPGLRTTAPEVGGSETTTSGAGTRMRVLVVEDNADVAAMLADVLDHLGCSVEVAVDGTEGLRAAAESPPALVLCDIGLPDIDGYEVAQRLRTAGYDGLLVAVTGYGGVKDRERAIAAGFDDHFTKPVSIDELRGIVADAEGRYAQRPPPAARSHLP